jgi:hypothetical protein
MLGQEESVFFPLLNFNLGLEAGQLLIVLLVLTLAWLITQLFKVQIKVYNLVLAAIIAIVAFKMCLERVFML